MTGRRPERKLLGEERRRLILERLDRQTTVTVEDLVAAFAVSAVTVRADLEALAAAGRLVRTHGGALRRVDGLEDLPIRIKESLNHAQKARIAEKAVELVKEGETVILDSGTTTLEIARRIRKRGMKSLTVITNALNIASELAASTQLRVIMLGGMLRHAAQCLVGPHAEQTLRALSADRAFIGVDGLDLEVGLSTPDVLESQLTATMMQVAKQVVIVADSSKFGRRSLSVIARLDPQHTIVTDSGIAPATRSAIEALGARLIVA